MSIFGNCRLKWLSGLLSINLIIVNCSFAAPAVAVEKSTKTTGFLRESEVFSSLKLLPPPPKPDSAEFIADQQAFFNSRQYIDKAPWKQAILDADYDKMIINFSADFGVDISSDKTPLLYNLLKRYHKDVSAATKSAKNYYKRQRPFAYFNLPVCTADYAEEMKGTWSYPSGHTTFAWGAALILAEINPNRAYDLFAKAYAYGQSRVICGAHWQSDVVAGRLLASSLVAVLHANKQFKTALHEVKQEVRAAIRQQRNPALTTKPSPTGKDS